MKLISGIVLTACALTFFAGCRAVTAVAPETPPVVEKADLRAIRVSITVSASGEDLSRVATHVENALGDELAAKGFSVIGSGENPDILVRGNLWVTDQTQRGSRMTVSGAATLSMRKHPDFSFGKKDPGKGSLISSKTLEARSPESYSVQEAYHRLGLAFDPAVRAWVNETGALIIEDVGACKVPDEKDGSNK